MPRPTCSPRLTPGQTSPRSSGNSFHHSRHCLNLQSRPTASSWASPTHLLLPKGRPGNPLSKHNLPPLLPKNVAWSSACAQLWLLTARSAAAAPRCQDLFRERAGGAKTRWAEEEEEEGAHILEHRGNQAHLSIRLSPTALCIPAYQMFNQSKYSLHLLILLDIWGGRGADLAPSCAKAYTRKKSMDRNLKDIQSTSSFDFDYAIFATQSLTANIVSRFKV